MQIPLPAEPCSIECATFQDIINYPGSNKCLLIWILPGTGFNHFTGIIQQSTT